MTSRKILLLIRVIRVIRGKIFTEAMQKILSAEEMHEIDRLTTERYKIPSILLMENAAHACLRTIIEKSGGSVAGKSFLILCGKGNNGGDGAALGRLLRMQGAIVHLYLFGKVAETKGDANVNFTILQNLSKAAGEWPDLTFWESAADENFQEIVADIELAPPFDFLIDALFGTGLTRPLDESLAGLWHLIKNYLSAKERFPLIVSVDLPSGLNADGERPIGVNVEADLTVTFTAPKLANVLPSASNAGGELIVAQIGSPAELIENAPSQTYLTERSDAQNWLEKTQFTADSYKNKRGHALLIAGSLGFAGAGALAGNAAMVSGVGLTTLAVPESAHRAISAKVFEEVMVQALPETAGGEFDAEALNEIARLAEKADAVGIGCGLGAFGLENDFVRRVVEKRRVPLVIDADGLNALAPFEIHGTDDLPLILTPHEGEFLRLSGATDKEILSDRVKIAREFAVKHQVILLLKGERALTAAPDGRVVINPTGNAGLGKAGNGDTLTGILTGFLAQGARIEADVFETIVAAVYIAGLAGDIAAEKYGRRTMLASDVRDCLGEAFQRLKLEV